MPPPHHCTNDAAHLPLAPYIPQVNLHHLNGSNDMSRHVVWANSNFYFLFHFISFIFITDAAMSLPCQRHHHPPPTHSLYHPAPPALFKWPKQHAGHVIWAYGNFFYFLC